MLIIASEGEAFSHRLIFDMAVGLRHVSRHNLSWLGGRKKLGTLSHQSFYHKVITYAA